MWPLNVLRHRTYERRYRAALAVFLGVYAFDRLNDAQKARVDDEVARLLKLFFPRVAHERWSTWDLRGAYRAVAMARVGIEPPIEGLTWKKILPRFTVWVGKPASLAMDFLPMDRATSDAKVFLRKHGYDIPEEDPWERGTLKPLDGSGGIWEETGLRKHFESKR